jgi:hypothetical protein
LLKSNSPIRIPRLILCNLQVVDLTVPMARVPKWFQGSTLNFAENLLRYNDDKRSIVAIFENSEELREISFSDLQVRVKQCAIALSKLGVREKDVVARKCFLHSLRSKLHRVCCH